MTWNPEVRDWAIAEFVKGSSAEEVSAKMRVKFPDHPAKSRNAIIGVAHRKHGARVQRRQAQTSYAKGRAKRKAAEKARQPQASQRRWNAVTNHDPEKVCKPDPEMLALISAPPPAEAPESLRLTIHVHDDEGRLCENTRLTNSCCRWPIGDPLDADFNFCGHETVPGTSWCEFHFTKAFGSGSAVRRRTVVVERVADVPANSNSPAGGQPRETEDAL